MVTTTARRIESIIASTESMVVGERLDSDQRIPARSGFVIPLVKVTILWLVSSPSDIMGTVVD